MKRIHFIAGLPRSGSTLLGAILNQNPKFRAGMSSPLNTVINALEGSTHPSNEYSVFLSNEYIENLYKQSFHLYYPNVEVAFDTNRAWASRMHLLTRLFPDAKFLCCVRNLAWVFDSFERLANKNSGQLNKLYSDASERRNVYSRVEALARPDRTVGFAYNCLREAYFGQEAHRLLLIDYEVICKFPSRVMGIIYEFLSEEYFDHDFDNVAYSAKEFDNNLGVQGLHDVKTKVEYRERRTILPPDLFETYYGNSFWETEPSEAKLISMRKN